MGKKIVHQLFDHIHFPQNMVRTSYYKVEYSIVNIYNSPGASLFYYSHLLFSIVQSYHYIPLQKAFLV